MAYGATTQERQRMKITPTGQTLGATIEDIDLKMMGCTLHINGELVETGGGGE